MRCAVAAGTRSRPASASGRRWWEVLATLWPISSATLLDRALALGQHVDDLGAAAVAERLGDRGERVEERVLGFPAAVRAGHVLSNYHLNIFDHVEYCSNGSLNHLAGERPPWTCVIVELRRTRASATPRTSSISVTAPRWSSTRPGCRPPSGTMPGDAGLAIAFTADTHTHADYISGSPELAADGATFLAPGRRTARPPLHGGAGRGRDHRRPLPPRGDRHARSHPRPPRLPAPRRRRVRVVLFSGRVADGRHRRAHRPARRRAPRGARP